MASAINIIINGIDNASGALGRVGDSLTNMGSKLTSVGGSLTAATLPLAVLGAVGIKTAADFETSMNVLSIAARSSGTSLEDLKSAAMAVGGDVTLVGVSASQAGDAMTEMYKAGLTTNQVFGDMQGYLAGTAPLTGALRAAIDLAAASELDLGQATSVVSATMGQFGLDASQATVIANAFVQTADAGQADVQGLAAAMANVGPVANMMGLSLEDTALALGLLAEGGIQGAEAGTNLKSMLNGLTAVGGPAEATLRSLGVSLYDASGVMLPMPNIIGQLERSMAGMTDQQRIATLDALNLGYGQKAMSVLLEEGEVGWNEMATAIGNAATVEESAAARTQGFNAAIETLKGVIETLMITALTPLIEKLTPLVQRFSEIATKVMETDPALMGLAVTIGLLAVAAGPVLMILGTMVTALGALLSPIMLIVLGIAALGVAFATNFLGIRDAIQPVIDIISTFFQTIAWGVEDGWTIYEWAETVSAKIPVVGEVIGALGQTIGVVMAIIRTVIEEHGAAVVERLQGAWTRAQEVVSGAVTAINDIVTGILTIVRGFLQGHAEEIVAFLGDAWRSVARIIDLAVQLIQATVIPILQGIATFISEHGDEIRTVIEVTWTAIKTVIDVALTLIEGIIRAVLLAISGDWEGAWETLKSTAETIWETIKEAIKTIAEAIGPILEGIWEDIKEKAAALWENIKQAIAQKVEAIGQAIEDWASALPGQIEGWWSDLKGSVATIWENVKTAIAEKIAEALENVVTWLDDTLFAIENFDLKAAAERFFGTVIPGIAAKITEVLDNVGIWLTGVFTKISAFDLKGAAETMFATAIAGIGAKIAVALTNVGTWLKDTFTKISTFDLKAAALAAFQTVVAGILAKAVTILANVETFLKDIVTKITNWDFKSATLTSLQTIIAGILQKAIEILASVGTFLTDIRTAITEFSLFDAGVNLIQGFINGIGSMVGGAIAAAVQVVTDAIAAAWAAVNPGSPSREGSAIGANFVAGISAGVISMGRELVEAIQDVMGDLTVEAAEQAAKIAEAITTIIDAIEAMIEVAGKLADFNVPDGIAAAIDEVVRLIRYVVSKFIAAAAGFSKAGLEAAAEFADAAGAIGKGISDAIEGLTVVMTYTGGLAEATILQFYGDIMTLIEIIGKWQDNINQDWLDAAVAFAEGAGAVGGAIGDAIGGLNALLGYTGGLAETTILRFYGDMMTLIEVIGGYTDNINEDWLAAAVSFATAAGNVGKGISDAIEGMVAAFTFVLPAVTDGTDALFEALRQFVARLQYMAENMDYQAFDAALRFAEAAGQIGQGISDAIDGMVAAFTFVLPAVTDGTDALFEALRMFVARLQYMAENMDYQAFDQALVFADAAGRIGQAISDAFEGLMIALTFRLPQVADGTDQLFEALRQFVAKLQFMASSMDYQAFDQAMIFAEAAGAIGSAISSAVEGLNVLLTYSGGLATETINRFYGDMMTLIETIGQWQDNINQGWLNAAVAFAQGAAAVGGAMKSAVEGLNALLTYTGGLTSTIINRFYGDIMTLIEVIGQWQNNIDQDWLDAAIAFATGAGAVGGEMKSAIEGLNAILTYVGGLTGTIINRFYGDIMTLIEIIGQWQDNIDQDWLDAAVAFAEGAGAVGENIRDAVEGLQGLMEYSGGLAIEAINRFYGDIMTLIEVMGQWTDNINQDWLDAAIAFAEGAGAVGGAINDAVEGLQALMKYTGGLAAEAIESFVQDMSLVVEKLQAAATMFSSDGLAAAAEFAEAAGSIGGGIGDAVEGLIAIADYSGVSRTTIDLFLADIHYLVQALVESARLFTSDGLAQAQLFAETAATIGDSLVAGYQGLVGEGGIFGYIGIGHDVIDLFLADMIYLVNKVVEAGTLFSTTGLTKADALSATMKAVGEALEAGIGGLIKPQGPAATAVSLSDYAGIAHDIFDLFLADMVYIVSVVQAAALEFTEKGIVQAGQFAAAGAEIFGAIEDGVKAAAAIANLPGSTGLTTALVFIVNSVTDTVTEVTRGFNALLVAGYHFGYDWVSNIIAGINGRLGDLEALLAYIRGLFPSSPAKYGAWRTLPDGQSVGAGFASDLATGLFGGRNGVMDALGGLRGAFALNGGGYGGYGGLQPAPVVAGGGITVNINNPSVRNDRDIERLANEISEVLARQATNNSRLGRI